MRNPLRRAYRQLSRLIVNEGFKEFAKFYGFNPNDPKYQEVKNAYAAINDNKNNELKDYYKAKLAEKGIDRSNLDLAYTKLFPTPEDFLNSYNEFQGSYKAENSLATLRRERDNLIKRYAGNVVEDGDDYIVYEVRTFEQAKQMRWLWMGDVPQYANPIPRERFDPNAPDASHSYGGNKTPEQMADYMMSNSEFIMNPSWCVCAGEEHWENYACDEMKDDGSASCYLIFSKIYPNARFCVVKNDYNLEIRDPWQGGGFDEENKFLYGYEVMQAVFGDSVKQMACLRGVAEKVQVTKFIRALDKDDVEVVEQILEQDLDPNYKDEDDVPLITYAVRYGAVKICGLLLAKGADINVRGEDDYTLLHHAAVYGHTEICRMLLEHGADVNAKDKYGVVPLRWAAGKGHAATCEVLLEYGADVHSTNNDGRTPLHWAARKGDLETCKLLLDHGADPNDKDTDGKTPLHRAVYEGYTDICKLLLEYGADANAEDNFGGTPLKMAIQYKRTNICELLRQYTTVY